MESEEYADLDPDTLISAVVPVPKVYLAANPVGGGQDSLAALMEELGLAANVNSFYYAGSAHVGRSGNDTIRLFDSGIATYEAEEGSDHFRISARQGEPTLFESVEAWPPAGRSCDGDPERAGPGFISARSRRTMRG